MSSSSSPSSFSSSSSMVELLDSGWSMRQTHRSHWHTRTRLWSDPRKGHMPWANNLELTLGLWLQSKTTIVLTRSVLTKLFLTFFFLQGPELLDASLVQKPRAQLGGADGLKTSLHGPCASSRSNPWTVYVSFKHINIIPSKEAEVLDPAKVGIWRLCCCFFSFKKWSKYNICWI